MRHGKVQQGRLKTLSRDDPAFGKRIGNSQSRNICDASAWDSFWVTSSRPYGTVRLSNLYPGRRPGLSSAVPAGLILPSVGSHAHLKPQIFVGPLNGPK